MNFIRNKSFIYFSLTLLFFASAFLSKQQNISERNIATLSPRFQFILQKKEKKAIALLNSIQKVTIPDSLFIMELNKENRLSDEGIFLFVKCSNELLYWSDNSVPIEQQMKANGSPAMLKLQNGWYELISKQKGELIYSSLILIKNEYNYQNKYLKNDFQSSFENVIKEQHTISLEPGNNSIYSSINNIFLFNILPTPIHSLTPTSFLFKILLFVGFLTLLFSIFYFLDSFILNKTNRFVVFVFLIALLRAGMLYYNAPAIWFDSGFFSADTFAKSFWIPSLGDFLIHVCLLFVIILSFQRYLNSIEKLTRFSWLTLLGCVLFLFGITDKATETLIEDSVVSMDVSNLFSVDAYSLIAFLIIGLLLFASSILALEIIKKVHSTKLSEKEFMLLLLLSSLLVGFTMYVLSCFSIIGCLSGLSVLVFLYLSSKNKQSLTSLHLLFYLVLIVFFETIHITKHLTDKNDGRLRIFAETLSKERDPIAENIFESIQLKFNNDTLFDAIIKNPDRFSEDLKQLLSRKYFNGYWEKYNLNAYLFDKRGEAVVDKNIIGRKDISNLETTIRSQGTSTKNKQLYYINDPSRILYYIAKIPINNNEQKDTTINGTLYIELEAKFNSEKIGFPSLLLDNNLNEDNYSKSFSYAKYNNTRLIHHAGSFVYPMSSYLFEKTIDTSGYITRDGFNHFISKKNKQDLLIVSSPHNNFLFYLTTFSYLLAFGGFLVIISFVLYRLVNKQSVKFISFRSRIQAQLIFVIMFSMAIFAAGTIFNIRQQYKKKNNELLSDKAQSVLVELEQLLKTESSLSSISNEYLSYYLSKLSNVFYTDINLFDINGRLIASSRYKLFEQGLISVRMNEEAYNKMKFEQKTAFIHDEKIGKLNYLSAYLPFESKRNETLAYINLPYFARQDELEDEISTFLVTIINSYLLLFILSASAAVFISNRITYPLKLISQKFGKIELGKNNEPIEWKHEDEIGQLVKEYNRMIDELSKSAEMLVRSEREGAWREMAKQVAHEIKNPLTPMKLSIQHLQRSLRIDDADWKIKFDKTAKTIIDQIETLSAIAGEFSDFAKLPQPYFDSVDIVPLINQVIDLFKNETSELHFNTSQSIVLVRTDKDHFIRIMNNLLKNSIQAISNEIIGKIEITLSAVDDNCLIILKDNGTGIPIELQSKIFMPNFTTKSAGTGLGLAMVKNMVEQSNGKIWFESSENIGTVFYIRFPLDHKTRNT